jgi:hypothetical protein
MTVPPWLALMEGRSHEAWGGGEHKISRLQNRDNRRRSIKCIFYYNSFTFSVGTKRHQRTKSRGDDEVKSI